MRLLNCYIVAIWLWLASRLKAAIWTKRSQRLNHLVLHAGIMEWLGGKRFVIKEFIPPHKALWTRRNFLVLFEGQYRATICRAVKTRRFSSKREMDEWVKDITRPS